MSLPLIRYKLHFFVPRSHLQACKDAVFAAGAGTYSGGKYTHACFEFPGMGQFRPGTGATPHLGQVGQIERVEEMKVEVLCEGEEVMHQAVQELKKAHPYEEVAYEVYRMENV